MRGPTTPVAPVAPSERIAALDMLRGCALLGILLVNMQGFARVPAAYFNPSAGGGFEGAEVWWWALVRVFADTKFLSIFSLLFGAGIALMSDRMAERGLPGAGLHYRRQAWLLAIGLAHAYLVWHGDILAAYAVCGLLLYPLRNFAPRRQLWLGACAVALVVPMWLGAGWSIPYWPRADRVAEAAAWSPPPEVIEAHIAALRGTWIEQMPLRAAQALEMQTFGFVGMVLWRAGGLMLVGMGLYRLGVLSAHRSPAFYRRLAIIGLGAGLPLAAAGAALDFSRGFAWEFSLFHGALFNYVGSVGVALGYVALAMLAVQANWLPRMQRRLAATGRMALTNYIAQSVACTLLFYGHGLGLFERVGAPGRMAIVAAVWVLQLAWSPWWLARWRHGPIEWAWRRLAYARRLGLQLTRT